MVTLSSEGYRFIGDARIGRCHSWHYYNTGNRNRIHIYEHPTRLVIKKNSEVIKTIHVQVQTL